MNKEKKKQNNVLSRRDFIAGTGAVILAGLLSGCKPETITTTKTNTLTTTVNPPATTHTQTQTVFETITTTVNNTITSTITEIAEPEATPKMVTDMAGRQVIIPATVNKIAVGFPALNQLVAMLGGVDKLVCQDYYIGGVAWFVKLYPQISDLPIGFLSTGANIETLAQLKPDVVFIGTGNEALASQLEELGIVSVMVMFSDPFTLKQGVNLIGTALGQNGLEKAQKFTEYYDKNVYKVTSTIATIPHAGRPKVYYAASGILNTEGQNTFPQTWIETGGGINVAAENGISGGFKDVTMENLIQWDPDYIVCRDAPFKESILSDARWANITAVKTGQVLIMPKGVYGWGVRSGEEALMVLWIAKLLHPDKFPDLDMVQETKYFYETFHDYTMTDDEANSILYPTVK